MTNLNDSGQTISQPEDGYAKLPHIPADSLVNITDFNNTIIDAYTQPEVVIDFGTYINVVMSDVGIPISLKSLILP